MFDKLCELCGNELLTPDNLLNAMNSTSSSDHSKNIKSLSTIINSKNCFNGKFQDNGKKLADSILTIIENSGRMTPLHPSSPYLDYFVTELKCLQKQEAQLVYKHCNGRSCFIATPNANEVMVGLDLIDWETNLNDIDEPFNLRREVVAPSDEFVIKSSKTWWVYDWYMDIPEVLSVLGNYAQSYRGKTPLDKIKKTIKSHFTTAKEREYVLELVMNIFKHFKGLEEFNANATADK